MEFSTTVQVSELGSVLHDVQLANSRILLQTGASILKGTVETTVLGRISEQLMGADQTFKILWRYASCLAAVGTWLEHCSRMLSIHILS